jgi:REP element-mobilizing transposase RayT
MARLARAEVFDPAEVVIAHVISRTVRRCFLFGDDPLSGKNFDHRKIWIEQYLQQFAGLFGIDLIGFSVLSNHYHLILRSRPDVVQGWDDTEVARRWWILCPHRKDPQGKALPPTQSELDSIRKCPIKLAAIRARLSDISWWMRLLNQRVAQRANQEEEEVGRFFQDRYKAVRLLDESSLLACAAYVDLNPIRAAMSETLEGSDHTSAQRRIESLTGQPRADGPDGLQHHDSFLSPVEVDEANGAPGPQPSRSAARASDKGFLWFSVERYLELLDWTARRLARGKRGKTPEHLAPILQRLGLPGTVWCELVADFGRLFSSVAGHPLVVDGERSRKTHRRFRLSRRVRELMPVR